MIFSICFYKNFIIIFNYLELYGTGIFTAEQISEKVNPLNEKKQGLLKELQKTITDSGAITTEKAIEYISEFEDAIEEGDFDHIRSIIEALVFRIELDNDDVFIHWKFA